MTTTTKTCPKCRGQLARPETITRWERAWAIHDETCPGGRGPRKITEVAAPDPFDQKPTRAPARNRKS
jgi:hypothetical protein